MHLDKRCVIGRVRDGNRNDKIQLGELREQISRIDAHFWTHCVRHLLGEIAELVVI